MYKYISQVNFSLLREVERSCHWIYVNSNYTGCWCVNTRSGGWLRTEQAIAHVLHCHARGTRYCVLQLEDVGNFARGRKLPHPCPSAQNLIQDCHLPIPRTVPFPPQHPVDTRFSAITGFDGPKLRQYDPCMAGEAVEGAEQRRQRRPDSGGDPLALSSRGLSLRVIHLEWYYTYSK